ncbi:hypothetical protein [Verrucomicrobium sp. 3C]|uniref:hypothetical protein n=1 Tax=Verrucomicrobium sp. 3C TaxID=1134055 RepID=UPI000366BF65|nr:hypothetical protein [Verrucomicrobium sp. 3C]
MIGVLLFLLFLPNRKPGSEIGKATHAAAQADAPAGLAVERSASVLRRVPPAPSPSLTGRVALPPPNGVDAFGLPANGAFETGSAQSVEHPLSLSSLASYLPIWGYLEGQEVIVGGRVYRPNEQLVIRTPSGLCKARVAQIDHHCLVLRDEEGTEVRVPWPRPSGGPGALGNEIFIDPTPSGQ